MTSAKHPVNRHQDYHAHVYFDAEALEQAASLFQLAGKQFGLTVGKVHRDPIGPHTKGSCQIAFTREQFDKFVPWIDGRRDGLTVFIHAVTGNDQQDHTDYAYWLGDPVALDYSALDD